MIRPGLRWTGGKGKSTPGDRILYRVATQVSEWLNKEYDIKAHPIPYQIYDGGLYLKDAAVQADLGIIGRNNLVIVPGFGPRIRFRTLWADCEVPKPDISIDASCCKTCNEPCVTSCPMHAFYDGKYHRDACYERINTDKNSPFQPPGSTNGGLSVDHCRICELVCPQGTE